MTYIYIFGIGCFLLLLMLLSLAKSQKGSSSQDAADAKAGCDSQVQGIGSPGPKTVRCLRCNRTLKIECLEFSNIESCPGCGFRFVVVLWDSNDNLYMSGLDDLEERDRRPGDPDAAVMLLRSLKLLGIDATRAIDEVSIEEIRKHYYKTIQQYHPDKYANLPSEFRDLAETKTREINEAYAHLIRYKTS